MQLTYLYNSGFLLETLEQIFIFDYYLDRFDGERTLANGVIDKKTLQTPKRIIVLSSHSHGDHFNPVILQWAEERPDIQYILANEIRQTKKLAIPAAVYLDKGDRYETEFCTIKAYGSTDIGISLYIELNADNKKIFHAGDLNNWHWEEESTPEETKEYQDHFLAELNEIAADAPTIDVAMFPIDPRLGTDYMRGGKQFVNAIATKTFVPMHFRENYSCTWALENDLPPQTKLIKWQKRGQTVVL